MPRLPPGTTSNGEASRAETKISDISNKAALIDNKPYLARYIFKGNLSSLLSFFFTVYLFFLALHYTRFYAKFTGNRGLSRDETEKN
jgi:hypothetical protein